MVLLVKSICKAAKEELSYINRSIHFLLEYFLDAAQIHSLHTTQSHSHGGQFGSFKLGSTQSLNVAVVHIMEVVTSLPCSVGLVDVVHHLVGERR